MLFINIDDYPYAHSKLIVRHFILIDYFID